MNRGIPSREIEWQPLRDAFVERAVRPTYAELESEFGIKLNTISRCAADEGWVTLRAARLEQKAKECDALAIVLEAAKIDRSVIREVADYALVSIRSIRAAVESIDEDRAPQTKLDAHNTANFALLNLAKSLHELGIIGVSKRLDDAGKEDNGRWNPQLLQQINLTVQGLQAVAQPAKSAAEVTLD